ncbi:MAG: UPF0182 family protein [Gemmatimonadaceae bacterium]
MFALASVLLIGRAAAVIFADHAWYHALDAGAVWNEKIADMAVIHIVSLVFAGLFALVNLYAIRRSIVSLAFPRRLANVEFGEEVPEGALDRAAFVLAGAIAVIMAFMVPGWEKLAALRLGARFGESDPFFQMDMSFYTAWLPLEISAYVWCITLLALVGAVVIVLYALTPSLRWQRGTFHVSVRVRRHLSILASMFLMTMAWSYRLDGYELLIDGSGPAGVFSYVDHQWLLPSYLSLAIGTIAAAVLVLLSGWMGHVRAGFFTVSAVLISAIALDLVLPSVVRRVANARTTPASERPYIATRAAFTSRAYNITRDSVTPRPTERDRFAPFADSIRMARIMSVASDSAVVYPGARGSALVRNVRNSAAPLLGNGLLRLANAWAEQRLDLLWTDQPTGTRIARRRDVRERAAALLPLYAQGSHVIPAYLGDTLVWILELYSSSETYPLSIHYVLAGGERSYFRYSGTAVINSMTGRVTVVPTVTPDPIATAWRMRYPANIRRGAPDLLDALTASPRPVGPAPGGDVSLGVGDALMSEVKRLYQRMRGALAVGDLKAFAEAYDSLGLVLGR